MGQVLERGLSGSELSSDECSPVNCQPCTTRGKTFPAKSYCEVCKQHLCQACCDHHSETNVLRHQRLSDLSAVELEADNQQGNATTSDCKLHSNADELIKCYRRMQNITACAVCAVKQHDRPEPDYIQDLSLDFMNSGQFKDFLSNLNSLTIQVETFLQHTEDNDQKTAENAQQLIEILEHRRDGMVKFINKEIDGLKSELMKLQQYDQNKLGEIRSTFTQYKKELDNAKLKLTKVKRQSGDLPITCMMTRFQAIQEDLKKAESDNKAYTYTFKTSDISEDLLSSKSAVGTVTRTETEYQTMQSLMTGAQKHTTTHEARAINWTKCEPVSLPDINIKSTQDEKTCDINGIEILDPNTLLISDYTNSCIKRVDINTASITGYLKLPSEPWNITLPEPDIAATTLPSNKSIQLFSTKSDLAVIYDLNVNDSCYGLSSTADCKLVVGYKFPCKVEVMDKCGVVFSEITCDLDGQLLFLWPVCLCVAEEDQQEVIYVSDVYAETLTKLSLTGQVLFRYKDECMVRPAAVTATGDGVLLCSSKSPIVQVISKQGNKVCTILGEKDSMCNLQSVCYDVSRKIVYVDATKKDKIKMFQMSEVNIADLREENNQ